MFNVHTPVWGDGGQPFLDVALPCLINNFQKCPQEIHVYTIYSTDGCRRLIEDSPGYKALVQLVPVEWQPLPKGEWEMTSVILQQFERGMREGCYVMHLTASGCLGDDCIANLAKLAAAGHNPILYSDMKISPKGWEEVREYIRVHGNLPNRTLVSIGMKHLLRAAYTVEAINDQQWKAVLRVFTMALLPDQGVIDLWATNPTRGSGYDHVMPYWMVSQGYPFYIVPHSDIYLSVDAEIFSPKMKEGQGTWRPDLSQAGERHFAQYSVIWQGEK